MWLLKLFTRKPMVVDTSSDYDDEAIERIHQKALKASRETAGTVANFSVDGTIPYDRIQVEHVSTDVWNSTLSGREQSVFKKADFR